QAAQFGLPLIGSRIGDIVNVCTEEGLAIEYFRTDDAPDLAEKIVALARDPQRERRMAEQNYAAAWAMTMPKIVEQYLSDFREDSSQVPAAEGQPLEPYVALPEDKKAAA
ncbi:MAG: hypothetical protein ACXVZR_15495, partial [Terriglobales bacterium]